MEFWRKILFTFWNRPAHSGRFRSWLLVASIVLAGSLTKSELAVAQQAAVDAPAIPHDERAPAARADQPAKKRKVGPLEVSGSWRVRAVVWDGCGAVSGYDQSAFMRPLPALTHGLRFGTAGGQPNSTSPAAARCSCAPQEPLCKTPIVTAVEMQIQTMRLTAHFSKFCRR